jgi:hypothetical protein
MILLEVSPMSTVSEQRIATYVHYNGKLEGPRVLDIDLRESSEWEL